ncbi:glycosyltransferase family 4 protein [Sphingomonas sp. CARO-RG-8B-R24-01]|uniref:glycosyltransferase family 4 protein n=1 Tax=Sphingomonas sp. CARO-RG-8B-R24-01 TaxID=2914831 RepID=UPI001F58DC5B|nr:glycosyltransferase family 4 protein [Sphingomonas sp. CARO-RG-8B-R24-01]
MSGAERPDPHRPIRVAMLAPIAWRTPPHHYGPWELATSVLTEALVARGIDVTLFATCDSATSGTLAGVVPRPYNDDPAVDAKVWEMRHVAHVMERAAAFDIIHNQADFVPLAFSRLIRTPIVTTVHGMPSERILPMLREYQHDVDYVAISATDRSPQLRYAATIPHGIDIGAFPFGTAPVRELLFFGRIHPDKGTAVAIAVARAANIPLNIAGIVQDQRYFEEQVRPHIDGVTVRYLGPLGGQARLAALGSAMALLHLIDFEEPFGLSVVEALACGTPVIAFRRGSMADIVRDGETGFVVDTAEQACSAIDRIGQIDRAVCRADVQTRFSADRMAADYHRLYARVLARR